MDDGNKIALIFFRKETARNGFEQPEDDDYQRCEDGQGNQGSLQNHPHGSNIAALEPVKRPVENIPELIGRVMTRLENQRAKRGAERERHEPGNGHRQGNGDGKLFIQLASDTA